MDINFKGRQTDIPVKFREQATAKLIRLTKLDQKAIRIDVEVSVERNPRLASQKERVELTVRSRGPAIRAEAAAEDRFAALDLALAKLDSRLRRALERRKNHHGGRVSALPEPALPEPALPEHPLPEPALPEPALPEPPLPEPEPPGGDGTGSGAGVSPARVPRAPTGGHVGSGTLANGHAPDSDPGGGSDSVVPIAMEGDGPLVVRQKFHNAGPITIDQALLEMELVGHDFYLFHDIDEDVPSVVYRRRGYQYGVIRLVDNAGRRGTDGLHDDGAAAQRPVGGGRSGGARTDEATISRAR
ncbi:MAG: ribosome hibernation-promoting factor, HPF/YfiA family [Streptosporangiaceae bacterium]